MQDEELISALLQDKRARETQCLPIDLCFLLDISNPLRSDVCRLNGGNGKRLPTFYSADGQAPTPQYIPLLQPLHQIVHLTYPHCT